MNSNLNSETSLKLRKVNYIYLKLSKTKRCANKEINLQTTYRIYNL